MSWFLILVACVLALTGAITLVAVFVSESFRKVAAVADEFGEPRRRWQLLTLPLAGSVWAPIAARLLIKSKRWLQGRGAVRAPD